MRNCFRLAQLALLLLAPPSCLLQPPPHPPALYSLPCQAPSPTLPGRVGSSSASSLVMQCSAPGMGSLVGVPPTAITMFLACNNYGENSVIADTT